MRSRQRPGTSTAIRRSSSTFIPRSTNPRAAGTPPWDRYERTMSSRLPGSAELGISPISRGIIKGLEDILAHASGRGRRRKVARRPRPRLQRFRRVAYKVRDAADVCCAAARARDGSGMRERESTSARVVGSRIKIAVVMPCCLLRFFCGSCFRLSC